MLDKFNEMYIELSNVNSTLDKLEILKKYPENKELLFYVYHPLYVYGVTSKNLIKNKDLPLDEYIHAHIIFLLDKLKDRKLTGHKAIIAVNSFIDINPKYEDLIYKIIDRNLKVGIGSTEINKVWKGLIPEFSLQLAKSYVSKEEAEENPKKKATKVDFIKDRHYSSRKMNGLRCTIICDEKGEPTCYSRTGKEFLTLDVLKDAIRKLSTGHTANMVFDGELCIIDENGMEDFKAIMKVYNKKNYTIPNPHYKLFDYLTIEEFQKKKGLKEDIFSKRLLSLLNLNEFHFDKKFMSVLSQAPVLNQEHFEILRETANQSGWEGIVIRKDIPYQGKRSKDMLKVKKFHDAEFEVVSIEETVKGMLNEKGIMQDQKCMRRANIMFKGYKVGVGSGWSDEERVRYYKNPETLIGKTITVRYHDESVNDKGEPSLEFPTLKYIYENGRDV